MHSGHQTQVLKVNTSWSKLSLRSHCFTEWRFKNCTVIVLSNSATQWSCKRPSSKAGLNRKFLWNNPLSNSQPHSLHLTPLLKLYFETGLLSLASKFTILLHSSSWVSAATSVYYHAWFPIDFFKYPSLLKGKQIKNLRKHLSDFASCLCFQASHCFCPLQSIPYGLLLWPGLLACPRLQPATLQLCFFTSEESTEASSFLTTTSCPSVWAVGTKLLLTLKMSGFYQTNHLFLPQRPLDNNKKSLLDFFSPSKIQLR